MKSLFEEMGEAYTEINKYLVPNLVLLPQKQKPIGIWGQRHLRHIKQHTRVFYANLLTSGKLNSYLADVDEQAENLFCRLVKEFAEKENVTEKLKAENKCCGCSV